MEPASLVKVVGAFVAGVVIAMGSALIYVRVSDAPHGAPSLHEVTLPIQPAATEIPVTTRDAGQQATPVPPSPDDDQTLTPEPIEPKHVKPAPVPRKPPANIAPRKEQSFVARKDLPKISPIQVAQTSAPPAPATQTPPAPDVLPTPPTPEPRKDTLEPAPSAPTPEYDPTPAPAPSRQPHVVTLDSGTALIVRLGEMLSTDHNYTGDTFRATLEAPIIRDGFIIADKGSKVLGRVVNAQKAGRVEGVAALTLALTEINTTDGQRVRIESTTFEKRGPTTTGEDTAKIAGGAALGAIIGAVAGGGRGAAIGAGAGGAAGTGTVLATRGKAAVLPTETRLVFHLSTPLTITEKLNF